MSSDNKRQLIANIGDIDPLSSDGFLVYNDGTAVVWQDAHTEGDVEIYQFKMKSDPTRTLTHVDWAKFRRYNGISDKTFKELSSYVDWVTIADIYRKIAFVYGYKFFVAPTILKRTSLQMKYNKELRRLMDEANSSVQTPRYVPKDASELVDYLKVGDKVRVKTNIPANNSGFNGLPEKVLTPDTILTVSRIKQMKATAKPAKAEYLTNTDNIVFYISVDVPNWRYGAFLEYSNIEVI